MAWRRAPIWQPQLPLALLSFFSPPPLFFVAFHPPPPLSVPSNQQNSNLLRILFLKVSSQTPQALHNVVSQRYADFFCKQRKVIMPFRKTNFWFITVCGGARCLAPLLSPLFPLTCFDMEGLKKLWCFHCLPCKMSNRVIQKCVEKFERVCLQQPFRLTQNVRRIAMPVMSKAEGAEGLQGPQRGGEGGWAGTGGSGQLQTSCQIHWDLKRAQQTAAPWASLQSHGSGATIERFTRWSNTMWFSFQMTAGLTERAKRERVRVLLVGRDGCFCVLWQSLGMWFAFIAHRYQMFHPKILVPLVSTNTVLTSQVAVVGRHHQQLSLGVLDNVTPMDGVCMAQEFVLVNINTPIQYLCTERDRKKRERKKWAHSHGYIRNDSRKSILQG